MDYIWALALNPMRGQVEERVPIARANTKEALQRFLEQEKVEEYDDVGDNSCHPGQPHTYTKVFRKGGPLEWFNWPIIAEPIGNHFQKVPSEAFYISHAKTEWGQRIGILPDVS
ncbi:hypothetical protein LCGC14_1896700 [marine sediment metagenome]|uniref:Uncharacterized protein n=1 Tax=marine sediment metagenome TaxID=412755 RepID=A0A0F9IVW9_9ZZZZ